MRYRLGVEDIEPGHWVAWAFDLPGCFSPGASRAEAIANAGASIEAYQQWLAAHEGRAPDDDLYIDLHLVESFQSFQSEPDYTVNAFFEDDRLILDKAEAKRALRLLEYTRADLLRLVESISLERRAASVKGEWMESIDGILSHIGESEWWYLDRLGLAFPRAELPDDPIKRLGKVRALTRRAIPKLVGDGQTASHSGETWSARKIVRRALWHERDHTQHIAKLAGAVNA